MAPARPAGFLFDLDGTLVDSVYEHVLAWREALELVGIELSVWRIHRRIGMSGGLLINALLRETGAEITGHFVEELQCRHDEAYARRSAQGGRMGGARPCLGPIGIDPTHVPVITRDQVEHAKPDPDLFIAASNQLGVDVADAVVTGTACGIFWRRAAHARSASAFSRAATRAKTSTAGSVSRLRGPEGSPSSSRRGRRAPRNAVTLFPSTRLSASRSCR